MTTALSTMSRYARGGVLALCMGCLLLLARPPHDKDMSVLLGRRLDRRFSHGPRRAVLRIVPSLLLSQAAKSPFGSFKGRAASTSHLLMAREPLYSVYRCYCIDTLWSDRAMQSID